MDNINYNGKKIFRLMNHDGGPTGKPVFESYTVSEYNSVYQTDYDTVEEAIESDPEYLYTEEEVNEYED